MTPQPTPEQSYCADQARRNDWDRFICALFAPREAREALFALIVFNSELARTRVVVSQPLLGQIRLQWWREAIAALYGETPPTATARETHPVLQPLGKAVAAHGLDRAGFDAMIDARTDELADASFADLDAATRYARATSGQLAQLQMSVLDHGATPTRAATEAADDVSTAWGLVELMRAGRISSEWADRARTLIAAARSKADRIDGRYLPVLLPATLAESYLAKPDAGRARRQLKLAFNAFRGEF